MQKHTLFTVAWVCCCAFLSAQTPADWRAKVAPEALAAFDRGETADLLVIFREQADVSAARHLRGKTARSQYVFTRLQATAEQSQTEARRLLRERGAHANSLYLVNAIAVKNADAGLARALTDLSEIAWLGLDPWVQFQRPTEETPDASQRNTIEWGIEKINAPALWALGFTGQGVTVGGADTGYDWAHPAIQTQYRGWNAGGPADHDYNWHDAIHDYSPLNYDTAGNPIGTNPCGFNAPAPCDDQSHGTHTMGTMVGDDGLGNQIGVAPGARWVGCRNMERGWGQPSTYLECFEWFLAPTDASGQNPDPTRSPDVINNSWYCATFEGCTDLNVNEILRLAVVNLKAAGVVVVVSNGNNGGICSTTSDPPAYFEESFSVGATRPNDTIAGFSSRGPVLVDGSGRMKPNVTAPGVSVRSCVPNGGYANFNGTSMAGPHVAGLVALLFSAKPDLIGEVEIIENIVEQTAFYLADTLNCGPGSPGAARPNHAYGWGRVDAWAAVNAILSIGTGAPESAAPTARVLPNPASDEAFFDLENFSGKTCLEIFSGDGQCVVVQNFVLQNRELRRVPVRHLPAGIYLYKIASENGAVSGKLVKK